MSNTTTFSFPLIQNIERVKYLELYHNLANAVALPLLAAYFIVPDEKANIIMSVFMPILLSIPLAIWLHNRQKKEQTSLLHIEGGELYISDSKGSISFRRKLSDFSHLHLKEDVRYDRPRWARLAQWWLIHPVTYLEGTLDSEDHRFYITANSSYELRQLEKLFQEATQEKKAENLPANTV